MKKSFLIGACTLFVMACWSGKSYEIYHPMKNHSWNRYNILRFEIPIKKTDISYDISLWVSLTKDFRFKELPFNMIMNTPSGEERINEYSLRIKTKTDSFLGTWKEDSCENIIFLKKDLRISKAGNLILDIENLTPRMETEGVLGIGIRVTPSSK